MKRWPAPTALLMIYLLGCAGSDEYILIGSARMPSTAGLLTVDADDETSEVELSMEFLPPPQSLSAKLTHYVAWIVPPQGHPIRLGALSYVARDRTATLTAESISVPYKLQITAESSATPPSPSQNVVAEAAIPAD